MENRMSKKMKCVCVAVGVALMAVAVWIGTGRTSAGGESTALKLAREMYERRVNSELEAFPVRVRESAKDAFDKVREQVPSVVEAYDFKKCMGLTKDLAIDKFKGGDSHRFKDAIDADMSERFYTPLLAARERVRGEWDRLQKRIGEERKLYLDICAAETKNSDDPTLMAKLEEDSLKIEEKQLELYSSRVSAVVSVVAETVMLSGTISSIGTVLGAAAAKACGAFGTGAVVSQCDTPMPGPCDLVGALIAAGGLAWTACDVRQAMTVLPRELETSLYKTIDDQEKGIVESLLGNVQQKQIKE